MRKAKREDQVYVSNVAIGILVGMILLVLLVAELSSGIKTVLALLVFAAGVFLTRR